MFRKSLSFSLKQLQQGYLGKTLVRMLELTLSVSTVREYLILHITKLSSAHSSHRHTAPPSNIQHTTCAGAVALENLEKKSPQALIRPLFPQDIPWPSIQSKIPVANYRSQYLGKITSIDPHSNSFVYSTEPTEPTKEVSNPTDSQPQETGVKALVRVTDPIDIITFKEDIPLDQIRQALTEYRQIENRVSLQTLDTSEHTQSIPHSPSMPRSLRNLRIYALREQQATQEFSPRFPQQKTNIFARFIQRIIKGDSALSLKQAMAKINNGRTFYGWAGYGRVGRRQFSRESIFPENSFEAILSDGTNEIKVETEQHWPCEDPNKTIAMQCALYELKGLLEKRADVPTAISLKQTSTYSATQSTVKSVRYKVVPDEIRSLHQKLPIKYYQVTFQFPKVQNSATL